MRFLDERERAGRLRCALSHYPGHRLGIFTCFLKRKKSSFFLRTFRSVPSSKQIE